MFVRCVQLHIPYVQTCIEAIFDYPLSDASNSAKARNDNDF